MATWFISREIQTSGLRIRSVAAMRQIWLNYACTRRTCPTRNERCRSRDRKYVGLRFRYIYDSDTSHFVSDDDDDAHNSKLNDCGQRKLASLWPNARLDSVLAAANRANKTSHISLGSDRSGQNKSRGPTEDRRLVFVLSFKSPSTGHLHFARRGFPFLVSEFDFMSVIKICVMDTQKRLAHFLCFNFSTCLFGIYLIILAFDACHFWS